MKSIIYSTLILCYLAAASYDLAQRDYKPAVLALLFGTVTYIIFFWR